jgi:hypothetical protein
MDWTRELTELFDRANTEGIHIAIQGFRTKYIGVFGASELIKELDQIKPANTHWMFTLLAAMNGISVAIFLIGMLIWKKCTNKTETPIPTPSAPPMPTHSLSQRTIVKPVTKNQAIKSNTSINIS